MTRRARVVALLEHDPATLPFIRSFLLGYSTSILPEILKLLLPVLLGRSQSSYRILLYRILSTLRKGFRLRGSLATSSGIAIGGGRWLERVTQPLVRGMYEMNDDRKGKGKGKDMTEEETETREFRIRVFTTLLATTVSSLIAISLLSTTSRKFPRVKSADDIEFDPPFLTSPYPTLSLDDSPSPVFQRPSSKTLDLTLFFLVRALDVVVRAGYRMSGATEGRYGKAAAFVASQADALVFTASCSRIMWCWFYIPEALPASYNRWIAKLARMDYRLLNLLRYARGGEYVYGKEPSLEVATLTGEIATAMGYPALAANPFHVDRLDCVFVHGRIGNTHSCEVNAAKRWAYAFVDSLAIYLPVHLIPVLLFSTTTLMNAPIATLIRILAGAGRSSAFLATFVGSIYASVCLVRTRLPTFLNIFGIKWSNQIYDSGLCVQLGCMLCGLSVLIENKRRRREMALYTAPRALYTLIDGIALPRGRAGQLLSRWMERSIFAVSAAVVTTATVYKPDLVSGVVRSVMVKAIGTEWTRKH